MNAASSFLTLLSKTPSSWMVQIGQQQQRFMSKYLSKSATKRLPLTTKRAGKGYYKGKGGTKEGRLTSKGRFKVDPEKRLELVVPDLEGFTVRVSTASWRVSGKTVVPLLHSFSPFHLEFALLLPAQGVHCINSVQIST
jgi:hypothetical protein